MSRLGAVYIVFLAAAALLVTESLAAPPERQRVGSGVDCTKFRCTQYWNHTTKGCPDGCRCSGLDRSTHFPKDGFCVQCDGYFNYPRVDGSDSCKPRARGPSARH
uniref:Evasin n=1 Tax=Rhipicephalus appendiculatus TaxID=34631 RepID=A0A131YWA2_RHIAP